MRLVSILAVFNYAGFFSGSLSAVLDAVSLPHGQETLRFLLPMGLSFHVFMAISYVVDATAGKLLPPGDPAVLAEAIRRWFNHSEEAKVCVASTRETALQHYAVQPNAEAMLKVLHEVTKGTE